VSIPRHFKDPNAKLDYQVSWVDWLASGETISTSTFAIDVAPDAILTISASPVPTNTTTTATVWLEAGTVGKTYRVRNRITSSAGRTDDQSFDVTITQK
jgi:hypothetical protein